MDIWLKKIDESDRSELTKKDMRDRTMKLWKFTGGVITPDKLIEYASKYKHKEDRRIARNFLKFASDNLHTPILEKWANEFLPAPKRQKERALFAEDEQEATKTIDELRLAIDMILESEMNEILKLRVVTAVVFASSTGLRPYELGRLTFSMLEPVLEKQYFILPSEISKTPFRRVIPVNKESKELLEMVFKVRNKIRGEMPFSYRTISNNLRIYGIPLRLEDLRHFATSYSLTVLKVPGITEAAIAAHDTDKYGIRLEHYVRKRPEEIRDDYLEYWNEERILTEKQRNEIKSVFKEIMDVSS